jgi:hypothetical protein
MKEQSEPKIGADAPQGRVWLHGGGWSHTYHTIRCGTVAAAWARGVLYTGDRAAAYKLSLKQCGNCKAGIIKDG